jgi:hypothetical protein
MRTRGYAVLLAVLVIATIAPAPALAQASVGSAFTYQGQLKEAGDIFPWFDVDLEFRLFDTAVGGTLLDTDTRLDVPVSGGLFMTEVLFNAANAFNGGGTQIRCGPTRPMLTPAIRVGQACCPDRGFRKNLEKENRDEWERGMFLRLEL